MAFGPVRRSLARRPCHDKEFCARMRSGPKRLRLRGKHDEVRSPMSMKPAGSFSPTVAKTALCAAVAAMLAVAPAAAQTTGSINRGESGLPLPRFVSLKSSRVNLRSAGAPTMQGGLALPQGGPARWRSSRNTTTGAGSATRKGRKAGSTGRFCPDGGPRSSLALEATHQADDRTLPGSFDTAPAACRKNGAGRDRARCTAATANGARCQGWRAPRLDQAVASSGAPIPTNHCRLG